MNIKMFLHSKYKQTTELIARRQREDQNHRDVGKA